MSVMKNAVRLFLPQFETGMLLLIGICLFFDNAFQ